MICPICHGEARIIGTRFDDRYGYPGYHALLLCSSCGHRMLDSRMTAQQLSDLYTDYYPRSSFNVDSWTPPNEESPARMWWRGLKASAYRWVPRNVRVLDIGCGFGESLGYHRSRGCDAHGVEADRNILRVAERYGLDVKTGLFDPANYQAGSFDVVTLDQVIEHVVDPLSVLAGVNRVLKPGGVLIVSTPNAEGWGARLFGRKWIHWHAPYHLQFFTARSIASSASQAGFVLDSKTTVTNSAWLDYQWGHLVTCPVAGHPSPLWSTKAPRTIAQRVALKGFRIVERLGINTLLTRLFDAIALGDNTVFVLRKPTA